MHAAMTLPTPRRITFPLLRCDKTAYIAKRYGLGSNLPATARAFPV
jgi:hypothetical protein